MTLVTAAPDEQSTSAIIINSESTESTTTTTAMDASSNQENVDIKGKKGLIDNNDEGANAAADADASMDEMRGTIADVPRLVAEGRKFMALNEFEKSVDVLAAASSILATTYGQDAPECAEVLFLYGNALLANAVAKSSPLGGSGAPESVESALPIPTPHKSSDRFVFSGDGDDMDGEPTANENEDQGAAAGANDDAEEGGNPDGDGEDGDGENEGDVDPGEEDMQIAWETLDLSRLIYVKMGPEYENKVADVLLSLGDVSLEQGQWQQAIDDYSEAVRIKSLKLSHDHRELAEAHYKLALALEFAKKYDEALSHTFNVIAVLERKKKSLEKLTGENEDAAKEIEEIDSLLPDITLKVDELKFLIEEANKPEAGASSTAETLTSGSSSSAANATVHDVSMFVKSKKTAAAPATSESTTPTKAADEASRKRKAEEGEAGVVEGADGKKMKPEGSE
ncbi:hypothetical protein HDU76_001063 [Blyttiomyces sp. JEL0837]|nr:hypothetical protein HDU76_001063 [Blyttiomyces sp. JEL0837]